MTRSFLALLCMSSALPIACENRGTKVEPTPETRAAKASSTPPSDTPSDGAPAASGAPSTPAPERTGAPTPAAATAAASASSGATRATRVSESFDELARFVQLPVRPASVVWQTGVMGKNEHPAIPGPSDYFLIAVLSYAPADADRLVAAQGGSPKGADVDTSPWFPAALRALAHPDVDGIEVLSGSRYDATSYTRRPFSTGVLHRIGPSGWFVLVLSTT